MTPLERAARALQTFNVRKMVVQPTWDQLSEVHQQEYLDGARTVMESLLEPSEGMLNAKSLETVAYDLDFLPLNEVKKKIWQAMMRRAMSEGEQG